MIGISVDIFKKIGNTVRITHSVLCALHLGCLFFGLMQLFETGTVLYSIFRWLSLLPLFGFPIYLMRAFDMQYFVFTLFAIWYIIMYFYKLIRKSVDRKLLIYDVVLWIVTIGELMYLEGYFVNIRYW